jgi:uncharacterized protein (DUF58 family)
MIFKKRPEVRRLERGGVIFIVAVTSALLAAWNSGTSLYYLIFGGMLSILVMSFFLSRAGVSKLSVKREAPHAVHRGQPFGTVVSVTNNRLFLPSVSLRVESDAAPKTATAVFISIPPQRTAQLRLTHCFEKRGVYTLPPVVLATSFPFGMIAARKTFPDSSEVVVYPRVHSARTAVVEQTGGGGEMPKVFHGAGDEFFSLREYVRGDDPRKIAWRVSARSQNLLVKELEQQFTRHVVFVLDSRFANHLDDFSDRFEDAIELVASLAVTLLNRQYFVAIVTPMETLQEGEGKSHSLKVLDFLARVNPADSDLPEPYSRATSTIHARHTCILLVSPDPAEWGKTYSDGVSRVLDPREVIHA